MTATSYLGKPTSRVDGRAKVTGIAKYAAEYNVADVAHGVVVSSAIAKGRIKHIDVGDALAVAGVLDVFTHKHRPALASSYEKYKDEIAPTGSPFRCLPISIGCRAIRRRPTPLCGRTRSSRRSSCRRKASRPTTAT